ncbi:hypothetical protein LY78DRAFT_656475 [Colletotrichum sublineola]|nr:hypothetical protein LY78DRAFT_656475 [Colletotrichum sublineola]
MSCPWQNTLAYALFLLVNRLKPIYWTHRQRRNKSSRSEPKIGVSWSRCEHPGLSRKSVPILQPCRNDPTRMALAAVSQGQGAPRRRLPCEIQDELSIQRGES